MPVKVWERQDDGLASRVVTDWETTWTSEEHRSEADALDRQLDDVLDSALRRVADNAALDVPEEFLRAWAVGREINDSQVLSAPAMHREQPVLLWRALARKCRVGARSDGQDEWRWQELRPSSVREPRREGGRLDYFEMCRWLAEQELADAAETFGQSIRNVWQMLERPTLRPLALRNALLAWLRAIPLENRQKLYERAMFAELMKTLRQRWPDRGPGSAKRPVHYAADELEREVYRVFAEDGRLDGFGAPGAQMPGTSSV
jgi:hypothetical protein